MNVSYAQRARKDLEAIATYLTKRNPGGAERVGAAVQRSIDRLAILILTVRQPAQDRLYDDL